MSQQATLYRMVKENHLCPFGLKAKDLLEREGFTVDDHHLKTQEETDAFREEYGVRTTPQVFIDGERIGGFDELAKHFGRRTLKQEGVTYQPIIAIFSTTFLMAIVGAYAITDTISVVRTLELFIAFSMCVLGILKLRDLFSFSNQFLGYDLLAQRWVRYAYIYPFVETGAGVLMIGQILTFIAAPAALFIGVVGGLSVFKAVYIDRRELRCACVGGDSNVPLGFVSLTENIMMVLMAVWMLSK